MPIAHWIKVQGSWPGLVFEDLTFASDLDWWFQNL